MSHGIPHHREGFSRFLVQSPLVCYPPPPPAASYKSLGAGEGQGKEEADYRVPYGSYHQLYRLDGRLIAVCACVCCVCESGCRLYDLLSPTLLVSLD